MQSWIVRLWLPFVLILFLFGQVNAVRLDQCKPRLLNETSQSSPTKVTYHQCVETCGGTAGEFKWSMFSQSFSAWLLPWITLMFQLPFGATDRFHNLISVFMAIGSPALAGYSLAITHLNSRWLIHQFSNLHFSNRDRIPLAVSALQHIPFRIDGSGSLLPSLIVLPQNNRYWEILGVATKRTGQWTIPVAMNIVWVLIAFLLTIVDSFVDFSNFITVPGDAGYSIAAAWTYLLPLVVGWLHVGSQPEANHLLNALNEASAAAHVATTSEPIPAALVTGHPTRAIESSTRHINNSNADEAKAAPIFNYSRVFIWSQSAEYILRLCENAAAKADRKITVQRGGEWGINADGTPSARNWIGNEAEVVRYCTTEHQALIDPNPRDPQSPIPLASYSAFPPSPRHSTMAFGMSGTGTGANDSTHGHFFASSSGEDEEASPAGVRAPPEKPIFATKVFKRVAYATVLALGLQWGTTGASVLIHLNTPPKGIGCRALSFTVYGAAATVAFLLLLLSSILAHLARRQGVRGERSGRKLLIGYIAMLTRWLGKVIAIMNGFGILLLCIMQFAGEDVKGSEVYVYWIGGIVMAFGVSGLYTFAIYVATPMK